MTFGVGQVTEYCRLGVGDTAVAQQEHEVAEGCWDVFGNPHHFCVSYRSATHSFVCQAPLLYRKSSRIYLFFPMTQNLKAKLIKQ